MIADVNNREKYQPWYVFYFLFKGFFNDVV